VFDFFLGQDSSPAGGDAAAGAFGALLGGGCALIQCGVSLAIWLVIAIWVMKDAKRRNSPNATLVTVLAWIPFTTIIGLIVHLITRPKDGTGSGTTTPPAA
jgi:NADH:ubiquinone oxidoreductase subunit 5 (subunit L)/multisubunit Na+/H+ antiporter MnhA subunit